MVHLKKALKVSLVSVMLVAGSLTTAQASHSDHSILPYVALGVFAGILHNSSRHGHSHYRYKIKRHHYGHSGHYSSGYQNSYSQGSYHYKKKRH